MTDYIKRNDALNEITYENGDNKPICEIEHDIKAIPPADVVSREAYDQIKWERNTAIAQLKELGYGLGEEIRHD